MCGDIFVLVVTSVMVVLDVWDDIGACRDDIGVLMVTSLMVAFSLFSMTSNIKLTFSSIKSYFCHQLLNNGEHFTTITHSYFL